MSPPGRLIGEGAFAGPGAPPGLARCGDCTLIFTNPRPTQERLGAYYAGNTYVCHDADESASGAAKARFVLGRLDERLPRTAPRTLLDYGAGGGGFLARVREHAWSVMAFEPGRRGLESCRALGLEATSRAEDLPAGRFGAITMHHVLEHIADPERALRNLHRVLAPEGLLLVEVPNAASLRARLSPPLLSRRFGVDERYRAFPIHLMYYTRSTLRTVLGNAGWDVQTILTMGLGMDEFFVGRPTPAGAIQSSGRQARSPAEPSPQRRIRHMLRDAFLARGLGENLLAIARPRLR